MSLDDPLRAGATNRMAQGVGELEVHPVSGDGAASGNLMVALAAKSTTAAGNSGVLGMDEIPPQVIWTIAIVGMYYCIM